MRNCSEKYCQVYTMFTTLVTVMVVGSKLLILQKKVTSMVNMLAT